MVTKAIALLLRQGSPSSLNKQKADEKNPATVYDTNKYHSA
jgi:hypothetical protein